MPRPNILINNAGVAGFTPALHTPTMANARLEMETNYLGTLAMCRAFAPVLNRNGGGALVNVLSVVSWFNAPMQETYCASKAAESSLTTAIRFELRAQGTLVVGVYAGYVDTRWQQACGVPKHIRNRARGKSSLAYSPASRIAPKRFSPTRARTPSIPHCSRIPGRLNPRCRKRGTSMRANSDVAFWHFAFVAISAIRFRRAKSGHDQFMKIQG